MQAIGYHQAVEYLHGVRSLPDTAALIKQKTRQFAKRQLTWFRKQFALTWLTAGADSEGQDLVETIAAAFLRGQRGSI